MLNNWLISLIDGLDGLGRWVARGSVLSAGEVDSEAAATNDSARELLLGGNGGSGIDELSVSESLGLVGAPVEKYSQRVFLQENLKERVTYLSVATRISMQLETSLKASKSSSLVML